MSIGRISSIKREIGETKVKTMTTSLAARNKTRFPGAGVTLMPSRETSGSWRTGLDSNSSRIENIRDSEEKKAEKERIKKNLDRLQKATGQDLSPTSSFWDYSKFDDKDRNHVQPHKLIDGDNLFDFKNPYAEITFHWLSEHPRIASSLEAYQNGEYPSDTQFYVYNEQVENDRSYHKKQIVNRAIVKLDGMSPENRKKVARLLALPVTDYTPESQVYNLLDTTLKQTEFKEGLYKGLSTVTMFLQFAEMKQNRLDVKDAVKQSIQMNIYRRKESGKIYEGDMEVSGSEEELVTRLTDDDFQDQLLALEMKLKAKKAVSV